MSNDTFLIGIDENSTYFDSELDGNAIFIGSYCIPIFWLSLFEKGDIQRRMVDGEEYPILIADRELAVEKSISKKKYIIANCPDKTEDLFGRWVKILKNHKSKYIAIEPYELWSMDEVKFEQDLTVLLDAFSNSNQQAWVQVLSQAAIDVEQGKFIYDEIQLVDTVMGYEL